MIGQRVRVGRHVHQVSELADGIELEGRTRLRPGREVDVELGAEAGAGPTVRPASVWTWQVVRVDEGGPVFRGVCRWR